MDLKKMYEKRFSEDGITSKNQIWKTLCGNFFSKYVNHSDVVVDIGAGYCEFINNIKCKRKCAIDINVDVKKFANQDVQVINESSMAIKSLEEKSVNVVFISNFLEHLQNKKEVYDTLYESKRILKQGGKIIILQPNIRFLCKTYWDFFDHHVPLSDRSLVEVLESLDMKILCCHPKFLPYTSKSRFPQGTLFVKIYLKFPILWKIFGKQTLIVAQKEDK